VFLGGKLVANGPLRSGHFFNDFNGAMRLTPLFLSSVRFIPAGDGQAAAGRERMENKVKRWEQT
jgi:hypothetical protein